MILRSGNAASFLVEFSSGAPDGNVTWNVLGPDGTVLTNGVLTVPDTAVSGTILVPASANELDVGELTSYRDVTWTYMVGGEVVNGEQRYVIEGRVPFGVTYDGVRNKLGVEKHELADEEISLVKAFYDFEALAGSTDVVLAPVETFALRDAIEALAALALLPTLQVRIALKESSGTNSFQRQEIDWAALAASLQSLVTSGIAVILPNFDPVSGFGAIFILASPESDPFTG